jgi:hypothetical protein
VVLVAIQVKMARAHVILELKSRLIIAASCSGFENDLG